MRSFISAALLLFTATFAPPGSRRSERGDTMSSRRAPVCVCVACARLCAHLPYLAAVRMRADKPLNEVCYDNTNLSSLLRPHW
jgi:hypothetical protein